MTSRPLPLASSLLVSLLLAIPNLAAEPTQGLRVTIRSGVKTHGAGEHDHPRFLEEWTDLLSARGCEVAGGLEFPSQATLAATDVLVMYAADAGSIHGDERERLEAYLGRGGGIVVLHDAVCGDDPQWFKTVVGGAWEHGHSKWRTGEMGLYFADREHPITRGVSNFDFTDEIYWDLHLHPDAHVLANAFHTPFDVTPQMWTFEKDRYRAFVSIQGHYHDTFANPAWRTLVLRGIAWSAGEDADLLTSDEEVAGLRYPPGGPRSPQTAVESLELHPDFEASLVVSEPLVVNPISIDWDARGRMWVACTPGYPYKQEFSGVASHDYVAVLNDLDGDGRMDEAAVFFEGLDLVTSLVHHGDGVIVTMSPHILWIRDTDGDDRADRVEVLYTGFGYGDTHATTSNLRLGMDGWIYGVQGYSGGASREVTGFATQPRPAWSPGGWGLGMDGEAREGAPGAPHGHIPNGMFRFRPDGSAIEPLVSYGSNTWGMDFAPDGELFFTMANGSHLRHVVLADEVLAGRRLEGARSWVDVSDHRKAFPISEHERPPYHQIDFVGGFTGAAGSLLYSGGAWPEEYAGDHFVCEPTINLVHRDVLQRSGPTFTASKPRETEFLASKDLWFRPIHLSTGPDGAMYLLDFYNQAAVHNDTRGPVHGPTNAAVRPDRDAAHGRIWRIHHRDARSHALTDAGVEDPAKLLDDLGHPNRWQRMNAQRLLRESGAVDRVRLGLFSHQAASPAARLHALWLLEARDAAGGEIVAALEDPAPAVRWNAARILGQRGGDSPPDQLMLNLMDEDPRVLLETLVALGSFDVSVEYAPAFVELYMALEDGWSRSAVLGVFADRPGALLTAAFEFVGDVDTTALAVECAARLSRRGDAAGIVAALQMLAERTETQNTDAILAALARHLPEQVDLEAGREALGTLLRHREVAVAIAALPLAARLGGKGETARQLTDRLTAITQDPDQPLDLRMQSLEALFDMPTPAQREVGVEAARRFLDAYFPLETQLAVIDGIGRAAQGGDIDATAASALVAAYPSLSNAARERAFDQVLRRADRAVVLLDAIEAGDLRLADLGPHRRYRLENHPDADVAARSRALLKQETDPDKDALIARLLPRVERGGDALAGRMLFQENCANCHTFNGKGGAVGPDLTGMGAHGAASLLPFMIDPNREVEAAYVDYVAETVDGTLFTGIVAKETRHAITLRSSAGEQVVPRDQLESLTSTGRSPMPEGFEQLGEQGLCDVLAYLTAGFEDFRVIDLSLLGTTSTDALYDAVRDAKPMRFKATGVVDVSGVPFEILDPKLVARNAIALKGGMAADWDSKLHFPPRVSVPVGFALERVHVLGGIAAWGFPYTDSRSPILRWTWVYADGERETLVMNDGDRFSDWIRRHDVSGSVYAEVLQPGSVGQVRHFSLDPARRGAQVAAIELESFDNHLSPTLLGLTAQVHGADRLSAVPPPPIDRLTFGGGSSHDFERWFHQEDFATLADHGDSLYYTEDSAHLAALLPQLEVLTLCNNQPIPDPKLREAIFAFADGGGGLLLLHPAAWYNWADWPQYNRDLVGGGARSHENYQEFVVTIDDKDHPVMQGVRSSFGIVDELYRFEPDPAARIHVLATGTSVETGEAWPVVWTVEHEAGKVLCVTLGHDGAAHRTPEFQTLLRNAADWLAR